MDLLDVFTLLCLFAGSFFFLAGTVGILRFPDVLPRLHAVTKADNLGLGFIVLGLALQSTTIAEAAKLVLVWGLLLLSSATSCYLIANSTLSDAGDRRERE